MISFNSEIAVLKFDEEISYFSVNDMVDIHFFNLSRRGCYLCFMKIDFQVLNFICETEMCRR
jgi:phage regulator Rha-like protein